MPVAEFNAETQLDGKLRQKIFRFWGRENLPRFACLVRLCSHFWFWAKDRLASQIEPQTELVSGSSIASLNVFHRLGNRQFVTTLVFWVTCMSAHQLKPDRVTRQQFVQLLPKLNVFDRFPGSAFLSLPAVAFPTWQPFGRTFRHIGAVGNNLDLRRVFQGRKSRDNGLQFHLIVGGYGSAARKFFLGSRRGMSEDTTPSTGAGISTTGPVRKELNEGTRLCGRRVRGHAVSVRGRQCVRDSSHTATLPRRHDRQERYG